MTRAEVEKLFTFTPLAGPDTEKVGAIRAAGLDFALEILSLVPEGLTRDSAVQHVLEAVMLSNVSIAYAAPVPSSPSKPPENSPEQ